MYPESDYLPLSGLQHLKFCPRQCALIHLEQRWEENFLTASGRVQHEKVHGGESESRRGTRTERSLLVSSSALGLSGQTDAVEFGADGSVCPVEYKHGAAKGDTCDEVQLCAQAICLEEMLGVRIPRGFLFYMRTKRRTEVAFTAELRAETQSLADSFHRLVEENSVPRAEYSSRCEACSLLDDCFPETAGRGKSVESYLKRMLSDGEAEEGE